MLAVIALAAIVPWRLVAQEQAKSDSTASEKSGTKSKGDSSKKRDDRRVDDYPITVTGTAADFDGQPVRGATVYLVSTNVSPEKLIGQTTTDEKGRYEFRDAKLGIVSHPVTKEFLPEGTFEVFGKSADHAFAWRGMKFVTLPQPNKPGDPTSKSYVLGDKIDLWLSFAPPKQITGRFIDKDGKPISGVKIEFGGCEPLDDNFEKGASKNSREFWAVNQAIDAMPELLATTTDDDGRFTFKAVPPNVMCWLNVSHPDYGNLSLYMSTAEDPPEKFDDGHPVVKQPVEMTLEKVRSIPIQVNFSDTGKPAADVRIHANQQCAAAVPLGESRTKMES